jgi:hypothetical protein
VLFPDRPTTRRLRAVQVWLLRLGYLGWPPIVVVAVLMRAWAAVGLAGGVSR